MATAAAAVVPATTPAALIHQNGQIIRTASTAFYGGGNAQLIFLSMNHERYVYFLSDSLFDFNLIVRMTGVYFSK